MKGLGDVLRYLEERDLMHIMYTRANLRIRLFLFVISALFH